MAQTCLSTLKICLQNLLNIPRIIYNLKKLIIFNCFLSTKKTCAFQLQEKYIEIIRIKTYKP